MYPPVGYWLAARMGKRPAGLRQLDDAWEEWSLSTRWPLNRDLVLAGRDVEQSRVVRWLRGEPAILAMQGESIDEAIAFLRATIYELPVDYRLGDDSRCLIAGSSDAARERAKSLTPLIAVVESVDPGLAQRLVQNGHHVY